MPITAPYNFVPLSKKVFFPDWADQVSHDIPFEDGISGEIVCKLTTQTPVYVRNGGNWERNDYLTNPETQSFFNVNGQVMIPGTSIKGMLRNVIEIATFGKMNRVDDHRYSVRDLNNRDRELYQKKFVSSGGIWKPLAKAAWLQKVPGSNDWQFETCSYARVEQSDLNAFNPTNPLLHDCESAVDKYNAWGNHPLTVDFTSTGAMNQIGRHPGKPLYYDFVNSPLLAGNKGTIVFTGQPGVGKHMEFIFFNPTGKIPVPSDKQKDFQFVHSVDGDLNKPNTEWSYWEDVLSSGGKVPVFYLEEGGVLHSFGLAQMYKLPYAHTIRDVVKNTSTDHFCDSKPDFAEILFGYISEKNGGQLKGRVSVTHGLGCDCRPFDEPVVTVLGAPKPTYYPSYLEQPDPTVRYHTYMDPNPKLSTDKPKVRGWKRYPAREEAAVISPPVPSSSVSNDVKTAFTPLHTGATFTFRIKIHNLKPAELGALLWALEWDGKQDLCHSLGMGKSFGYGLVKIKIDRDNSLFRQVLAVESKVVPKKLAELATTASDAFFTCMKTITADWRETPQIFQLLAMADPKALGSIDNQKTRLRTMTIDAKEFAKGKNQGQVLPTHKEYIGVSDEERFAESVPVIAPVQEDKVITPVSPPADSAALLKLAERYKKR